MPWFDRKDCLCAVGGNIRGATLAFALNDAAASGCMTRTSLLAFCYKSLFCSPPCMLPYLCSWCTTAIAPNWVVTMPGELALRLMCMKASLARCKNSVTREAIKV
jgi:hypothetical protein